VKPPRDVIPFPFAGWRCGVCDAPVGAEWLKQPDGSMQREPVSKYWNAAKQVAYCGPECSVAGHSP
jgi:hypothetical protein